MSNGFFEYALGSIAVSFLLTIDRMKRINKKEKKLYSRKKNDEKVRLENVVSNKHDTRSHVTTFFKTGIEGLRQTRRETIEILA